ncbi:MAG: SDR family oxidoreductase [Pirellulales bacterium]|nr:SDR family oxidoreductase [Pirellulales bacterium]
MHVLLTGASGQLGAYLLRALTRRGVATVAWSGRGTGTLFQTPLCSIDLADQAAVRAAFDDAAPDVVIHTAAMSAIADVLADPDRAHAVNTAGTCLLAELAAARRARLVYISTDLVFDGEESPCRETTPPRPLSIYGRTKLLAEPVVLDDAQGLVIRVSLLFGPTLIDRPTFFDHQVAALREGRTLRLFDDEWRTPLDLDSAAAGILAAAQSDVRGILLLGGRERLSRLEMGQQIADACGASRALLEATSRLTVGGPEPRPRDTALDSSRFERHFPGVVRPSFAAAVGRSLFGDGSVLTAG